MLINNGIDCAGVLPSGVTLTDRSTLAYVPPPWSVQSRTGGNMTIAFGTVLNADRAASASVRLEIAFEVESVGVEGVLDSLSVSIGDQNVTLPSVDIRENVS